MRRILLVSSLASMMSGCANTPHWSAPEAAKLPRRLNLHIEPFVVHNKQDLEKDLKLDSAGFQTWLAPLLAEQLKRECRIDSVILLAPIPVQKDTLKLDDWTLNLSRPSDTIPPGWTLMLSSGLTSRLWRSAGTQPSWVELVIGTHYLLIDGDTGRDLAYGAAFGNTAAPTWEPNKEGMIAPTWEKTALQIPKGICKDLKNPSSEEGIGTEARTLSPKRRSP